MKNIARLSTGVLLTISVLALSPFSALASFNGVLPIATVTPASGPTISLSSPSLAVGQSLTATIRFPSAPTNFTIANLSASHGTFSNFAATGDPKVFTVTYSPTSSAGISTDVITVAPTVSTATYTGLTDTPGAMAFDGTNMWVAYENSSTGHISKVAPDGTVTTTGGVDPSFALGLFPQDGHAAIAFDGTNMWVGATSYGNSTYKLDKVSPTGTVSSYTTNADVSGLAFDGSKIWAGNGSRGSSGQGLSTFSSTGVETTVLTGNSEANDVAFDGTNMWTANLHAGSISEVAPNGTIIGSYPVTSNPHFISFDGSKMWYSDTNAAEVGWSTLSGSTHLYSTGSYKLGKLVSDGTYMWGGDEISHAVVRVASDGSYVAFPVLSGNSDAVAFDGTNIWSANSDDSITKITPMIAASSSSFSINIIPVRAHSHVAVVPIIPSAMNGALGFTAAPANANHITLNFNANPSTVTGYSLSTDPTFASSVILPYPASATASYDLPMASGTYPLYLVFISPTGTHSPVMTRTVSLGGAGSVMAASTNAPTATQVTAFTRTLRVGSQGSDVSSLQAVLVKDGELVMPTGASYGSFGATTQKALEAFQTKYSIVARGDAGYGVFGPKTRAQAVTITSGN